MRLHRCVTWLLAATLAACASQSTTTTTTTTTIAASAAKASSWARAPVNGGELEYRVVGKGEPVLLIHGSVFASAFDPLLPEAALSNYQLVTYHRRGFAGSTRAQAPFTMAQQAQDAVALLDRLGIQRAHLVGHSYGGAIALQLATVNPDRVASLVLLEPALFPQTASAQELFGHVTDAIALFGKGDARGAIARFASGITGPGAFESMPAAMQEQAIADAATFFNVELPAMQDWRFTYDDIAKLRFPILAVVGANSHTAFRDGHNTLRQTVPQSEELVVQGVGHELQMEQPRTVAEGIAAFLKKHPIR